MTTFENKTICLVSRYPFWSAFRKLLAHLHTLVGTYTEIPLERWISHLLLTVPLPSPGGPIIVIPTLLANVMCSLPPEKDFPLVDLPYSYLFSCLEIKTVVTIVLGLLALERKAIIISTRPSLVLDVCELLRSLLFPFELCAPYVPRLTEPFKSSLDFPGAIFVGIHDDGEPHGLGTTVKKSYPEESIVIDLDTGVMDCSGDRYDVLSAVWDLIPHKSRNALVSELETLCRDAKIVDGQEPLDSLADEAFLVDLSDAVDGYDINLENRDPLDDRAVRDAFLRFFCSVLGGYEQFLVVPDADFLVSGNEWFDAKGFLASVPAERASYLGALVSTQLFQSFIQKRTEASDIHCMLFDECLVEYHSTTIPYGRLGGDLEEVKLPGENGPQRMLYSLLVDQAAKLPAVSEYGSIAQNRSMDGSDAERVA
jgi:DENN domain-containing protein 4